MEENIRKVLKSRISTGGHSVVKRGRFHRFAKWCSERYGISWRGVYESFRGAATSEWKISGMESCIREYSPEYEGTPLEFWNSCHKNRFALFMTEKGISRGTIWKRFPSDDWNELELKGIRRMYEIWLNEVELKSTTKQRT